jgi:outer membrane lipopolysaccharide assembly protein LptE/RlpB
MRPMTRRTILLLAAVALTAPLAGCGYSLAGRGSFLPPYIKKIAIPPFTNGSTVIDAERILTERVQREFISRGKFSIVPDRTGADAIVIGEITGINFMPAVLTQQQQASRYVLTVTAKIEFTDLKANKVLWANPSMQFRDEFEVSTGTTATDANTFFGQNADALQRVATEFARAIVSAIVEAF